MPKSSRKFIFVSTLKNEFICSEIHVTIILLISGGYGSAGEQPEHRYKPGDRAEIRSFSALFLPCYQ
jgi:hypothetical protein